MLVFVGIAAAGVHDVSADERPHPTLVDAATTRCAVCHTAVATTHTGDAARTRPCLDCHAFNTTNDATSLTTEAAGATVIRQAPPVTAPDAGAAAGVDTRRASEIPSTSAPPASAPSTPGAAGAPAATGATTDRTRQLYLDGRRAFYRGQFDEAFDTWRVMLGGNPDAWVLQVEIDSLLTSAQSTLARFGDHDLYVVMKDDLHYVLSGVFASENDAATALRDLPQPLRSAGAFPIRAREILAGR